MTPELDAVRHLVDEVKSLKRELRNLQRATNLGRSSIDSGALVVTDADGAVTMSIGTNEDGTTTVDYLSGPTPGIPTAPDLTPVVGALVVTWDGRLISEDGTEVGVPADFEHVGVYVTQDLDPDNPEPFDLDTAELAGVITSAAGGSKTVGLEYGRYEVRLVARSRAGMYSEPSEPVTADVEQIIDSVDLAPVLADLDERLELAGTELAGSAAQLEELRKRFVYSEDAPTPADAQGRLEGSTWTQTKTENGVSTEVGRWQLKAGAWVAVGLDPTVIPELLSYLGTFQQIDVSKLIAKDATMDSAVVLKLFTEIFTAKKITADQIEAEAITADKLRVGALDAITIKSGSFDGGQYTMTSKNDWVLADSHSTPQNGSPPYKISSYDTRLGATRSTVSNLPNYSPYTSVLNSYINNGSTRIPPVEGKFEFEATGLSQFAATRLRLKAYMLSDYTTIATTTEPSRPVTNPGKLSFYVVYQKLSDASQGLSQTIYSAGLKKVGNVVSSHPTGGTMGWWELSGEVPYLEGYKVYSITYTVAPRESQVIASKRYAVNSVLLEYGDVGESLVISTLDSVPGLRGFDKFHNRSLMLTSSLLEIADITSLTSTANHVNISETIRIPSTVDASTTSTEHPFQIGPDTGVNLRMDNNKIVAANDGALSPLYFDVSSLAFSGSQNIMTPASRDIGAIFTQDTNWRIDSQSARMWGPLVQWRMTFTYIGNTPVTVPASGNIGNQTVATIGNTLYRPLIDAPVSASHAGPGWAGSIAPNGGLGMASINPGNTISNGNKFSAQGMWLAL